VCRDLAVDLSRATVVGDLLQTAHGRANGNAASGGSRQGLLPSARLGIAEPPLVDGPLGGPRVPVRGTRIFRDINHVEPRPEPFPFHC
jgi:hypothetical protein